MTRHIFRSTIFITAMLAASAAFAGADIVKCVDQNGKVTLTDAQCSDSEAAVTVAAGESGADASASVIAEDAVPPTAPVARRAAPHRVAYAPPQIQHDSWSPAKRAGRMLARDVETLKAARMSMRVLDSASASARQQRVAGLN